MLNGKAGLSYCGENSSFKSLSLEAQEYKAENLNVHVFPCVFLSVESLFLSVESLFHCDIICIFMR